MLEYGPIIILVLVSVGIVIGLLPEAHDAPLQKFREECRAGGMDFAETEAAIAIRTSFVRLRRMASDQCVAQGGKMDRDEINQIASQVAIGLAAAHGREAAKSFIGWIDSCPDEEILYDDARGARHRNTVEALRAKGLYPPKNVPMSEDLRTAFRIVKR
ncbi:hypothetical protein NKI86_16610 [Mesorhizobium sp. M0320]|uniref:hypothetical protein n=1 Tax=unclassified Mesorhizobium TaxID=325217 RepID=UPI00333C9F98